MNGFVKVIVHNLAQVDDGALLDLHLGTLVELDSRGVDKAQVPDKVLTTLIDDHELRLPQLLVVGDLIVVSLTLAHLVNCLVAFEQDLYVLELLSVNALKSQLEALLREDFRAQVGLHSLHETGSVDVLARHIFE